MQPFDAVLIVSFGGPQGPDDVRPFLENVLRGRRVAPGRLEEVAHHYELFGGVSPLTALTMRQAAAHRSYSSCTQYRENVAAARAAIVQRGLPDVEVTYVGDWFDHEGFIAANAARALDALARLPATLR